MGLHTSHNAWDGSYAAFGTWRTALARAAGYDTTIRYDTFGGFSVRMSEVYVLEWSQYEERNYFGTWGKRPDDPLIYLLVHSDCDGYLTPTACRRLAGRLEGLLPLHPYRAWTERFINGLYDAWLKDERLVFNPRDDHRPGEK